MNYSESLRYLNTFLNFERIPVQARTWNLKNMRLLIEKAGHPEKNSFFPILIAGTKGKGSTGVFLEALLQKSDIKTGFYSSPHLEDPRERIRINGKMISEAAWSRQTAVVKRILTKYPKLEKSATYFEVLTLMAILAFKEAKVQIGIFEVGMGGRLDATNVLAPKLAILTPIHLDHEAVLGPTIAKIAAEKAAIIRPRAHIVVSPQISEAQKVIQAQIRKKRAFLYIVRSKPLKTGLIGDYQQVNASSALQAAAILKAKMGFNINPEARLSAFKALNWPGRFERFQFKGRTLILDAAHNPVSIEALVRNLKRLYPKVPRTVIFGTSRDKKAGKMLSSLKNYFTEGVLTRARNSRSFETASLLALSRNQFQTLYPARDIQEALKIALEKVPAKGMIVITGSFYLVGEARPLVRRNHA